METLTFGLIPRHNCVEPSIIVSNSVSFERLARFWLPDQGSLVLTEICLQGDPAPATAKTRLGVNSELADRGLSVFNFVISHYDLDFLENGIHTDKVMELFELWQREIEKNSLGVVYFASGDDGKIATYLAKIFLAWRAPDQ